MQGSNEQDLGQKMKRSLMRGVDLFTECIILPKKHKVFDITVQNMAELKNVFPIKKKFASSNLGGKKFLKYHVS